MKKLLVLFILLMSCSVFAADYYVSPTGNDSNDGSQGAPWATIQKAFDSVTANDVIHMLSGTYLEDGAYTQTSGPITLQGESDYLTIIKGRIYLNHDNYTVKYLNVIGDESAVSTKSMVQINGNYINIQYCHFSYCAHGIEIVRQDDDLQSELKPNHITISNSDFSHGTANGFILLKGPDNIIENNYFHNGDGWDALRVWGINCFIRDNRFEDINAPIPGTPAEGNHADIMQTFETSNITFAKGIIFERNVLLNCDSQFGNATAYLPTDVNTMGNWTIRNNLLINSRAQLNCYLPGFKFYNNTVYANAYTTGFRFGVGGTNDGDWTSGTNGEVYNNLFIRCVASYGYGDDTVKPASDHNFVTDETDGPSDEQGIIGEPQGITGNYLPSDLFVDYQNNNFHLKEGAPAIDQGTTISSFNDDMDGNIRPIGAAWDIGCYEGESSGVPPVVSKQLYGYGGNLATYNGVLIGE